MWPGHPSTRKLQVPLDSPSQEARGRVPRGLLPLFPRPGGPRPRQAHSPDVAEGGKPLAGNVLRLGPGHWAEAALRRPGGREQRPGKDIHQPQITFPTLKGPVKHGRKLTCQGDRWAAIVAASRGAGSPPPLGSYLYGGPPLTCQGLDSLGAGARQGEPWGGDQATLGGWAGSSPPPPTRPAGQTRPSCRAVRL